ncbi:hypothetical protein LZ30DRAFT_687942 [Colletotrichum cereale]|nr:hypothetical protein LZ30DRAFT_687942 [Colletotrichum cereale]
MPSLNANDNDAGNDSANRGIRAPAGMRLLCCLDEGEMHSHGKLIEPRMRVLLRSHMRRLTDGHRPERFLRLSIPSLGPPIMPLGCYALKEWNGQVLSRARLSRSQMLSTRSHRRRALQARDRPKIDNNKNNDDDDSAGNGQRSSLCFHVCKATAPHTNNVRSWRRHRDAVLGSMHVLSLGNGTGRFPRSLPYLDHAQWLASKFRQGVAAA